MSRPPVLDHLSVLSTAQSGARAQSQQETGPRIPQRRQKLGWEGSPFLPPPPPYSPASPLPGVPLSPACHTYFLCKLRALQGHTETIISTCLIEPHPSLKDFLPPELRGESFFCWSLQSPAQTLRQASGPPQMLGKQVIKGQLNK